MSSLWLTREMGNRPQCVVAGRQANALVMCGDTMAAAATSMAPCIAVYTTGRKVAQDIILLLIQLMCHQYYKKEIYWWLFSLEADAMAAAAAHTPRRRSW